MSDTVRTGLVFGIAAAVAFIAALFIPLPPLNGLLALVSVLALGWGAGYTATKQTGGTVAQGATAGAIAGAVQVVAFIVLVALLLNTAFVEGQIRGSIVGNQGIADRGANMISESAAGSRGLGLFCGGINLVLMVIASAIGGVMGGRRRTLSCPDRHSKRPRRVPSGGTSRP